MYLKMIWITVIVIILIFTAVLLFIHQPSFGRLPDGERKERILRSPNYREGKFQNLEETHLFTGVSGKSRFRSLLEFAFRKVPGLRPDTPVQAIKTDLRNIARNKDMLIWFGHSSYLMQIDGKRILVDPVFCMASPVSFFNKPFAGTDIYHPGDIPEIDYLVITHDHWDHLDYQTVVALKGRTGKVICGLGVGEHFERWGFDKNRIVEMDWNENIVLDSEFTMHCLPARHFSGRGLTSNQSLWASYLVETPSRKIYMAGDGGYGSHYAVIGKQFPDIDLAILENGQYNEEWKYIHLMPQYMAQAAKDLNAKKILTVHHSKYALARHKWDEPLENALNLKEKDSLNVWLPVIGEIINLKDIVAADQQADL